MATASLSTSPTQLDAGSSDNVSVTNTGTVDVVVARGAQSFTLRPTQGRVVYPEGVAVTAATVSGSGSVSYTATAARLSQQAQFAADPAFTGTYASILPSVGERLRRAAASAQASNSLVGTAMATPPTITQGTTNQDGTLTKSYLTASGGTSVLRVTGGASVQGTGSYTSFRVAPVVTLPSGAGGNTRGDATKNSYQWTVEFVTDAPKVQIAHVDSSASTRWMCEVDGQMVSATALTYPANTGGTGYALLDFTSAGGSQVRHFRIEYQLNAGFLGVYVGPTYNVWAPQSPTNLRVVTVGDSIDAGTGATLPNGQWSHVAGKLLGWTDVRNVSFSGTGFVNVGSSLNTFGSALRVSDVVSHNPDLFVISASQNDDNQAGLQAATLAAFQAYRTALPTVPIVVVGVDSGSSGPSAARLTTDTTVKAAFTAWADGNSWWIPNCQDPAGPWQYGTGFVGTTTGTGNRDRLGFDTAHPNDTGHAFMGRRFVQSFRALVLPYVK